MNTITETKKEISKGSYSGLIFKFVEKEYYMLAYDSDKDSYQTFDLINGRVCSHFSEKEVIRHIQNNNWVPVNEITIKR